MRPGRSRLHVLSCHLSPATAGTATPVATLLSPTPGPAAATTAPTAVALEEGDLKGHVHPSICLGADGTLVVVYALDLDDSQGKDALCCVRSKDSGATWSAPVVIDATIVRPPTIRDTGNCEVYSGTLTTLPDTTLLLTWQYRALGDDDYTEGALCHSESSDHGQSWSELSTITDPANPPDITSNDKKHLGAMRHGMLTMEDGRWLLPLRDPKPEADSPWGPRLYNRATGSLGNYWPLWPSGGEGYAAHEAVRGPIKQVVRTARGSLVAMCASGGAYTPPGETTYHTAPVLHLAARQGLDAHGHQNVAEQWTDVSAGFPAGQHPPPGVAMEEWDDDGDREGRFLCPLADGRVVCLWGYAHDPRGVHCNVSGPDGAQWDEAQTVTLLPDAGVVGRYYSPRAVQLPGGDLAITYKGPSGVYEGAAGEDDTGGVYFLRAPLEALSP